MVVNAITLEPLSLAQESFEKLGYEYSVTQICASRGRKVGGYNMMTAQTPVFIFCGEKLCEELCLPAQTAAAEKQL